MGKEGNHLSFRGAKNNKELNCVWWRHSDIPVSPNETFDLVFEPKENQYNGEKEIRLYTLDLKCENMNTEDAGRIKFYDHRQKTGILAQIEEYVKRPNVDVEIFAKKIKTKTALKNYPALNSKIKEEFGDGDLMFFDYPASEEDFIQILKNKKENGDCKIHLMKEDVDFSIENHIKQLIGMLKYATNNKNGEVSISELSDITGTSEIFIQHVFNILKELNSLEIFAADKIKFLAPPSMDNFYNSENFSTLNDEFNNIIEFKKYLAQASLDDIENLLN